MAFAGAVIETIAGSTMGGGFGETTPRVFSRTEAGGVTGFGGSESGAGGGSII